jgi:hypothetical protein
MKMQRRKHLTTCPFAEAVAVVLRAEIIASSLQILCNPPRAAPATQAKHAPRTQTDPSFYTLSCYNPHHTHNPKAQCQNWLQPKLSSPPALLQAAGQTLSSVSCCNHGSSALLCCCRLEASTCPLPAAATMAQQHCCEAADCVPAALHYQLLLQGTCDEYSCWPSFHSESVTPEP